eukprot:301014-Pyramimonas_sp.AAC.1
MAQQQQKVAVNKVGQADDLKKEYSAEAKAVLAAPAEGKGKGKGKGTGKGKGMGKGMPDAPPAHIDQPSAELYLPPGAYYLSGLEGRVVRALAAQPPSHQRAVH